MFGTIRDTSTLFFEYTVKGIYFKDNRQGNCESNIEGIGQSYQRVDNGSKDSGL